VDPAGESLSPLAYSLMADVFHRSFFIDGPAGRLEAMLWTVANADPSLVAVVCHPHPLFGGTMHNKVVFQAAKAIHSRGIPVLRFNFRGAGLSEGVHDKGRGEQDDVRAALDYLAREFPGRPILLAGFSFGAWVGLRVGCGDARVTELIGLGLLANNSDSTYLRSCVKAKLIIQGGSDEFGSRANVEALFATMPEPKRLVIVDGADHFFAGKLDQVGSAIDAWIGDEKAETEMPR
jgi:alpha/beta superfamily hydrolase